MQQRTLPPKFDGIVFITFSPSLLEWKAITTSPSQFNVCHLQYHRDHNETIFSFTDINDSMRCISGQFCCSDKRSPFRPIWLILIDSSQFISLPNRRFECCDN
jgi:hypothetical protein